MLISSAKWIPECNFEVVILVGVDERVDPDICLQIKTILLKDLMIKGLRC